MAECGACETTACGHLFGSNVDPNPDRNWEATVLCAAPALPDSKITNVPQHQISPAAQCYF